MAADKTDLVKRMELWIAGKLAAIKEPATTGKLVFRNASIWKHQIQGSADQFTGLVPFAFVSWQPQDPEREGGYDPVGTLRFVIGIGTESKSPEGARVGSAEVSGDYVYLGASRLRELVFNALENEHPDTGAHAGEEAYPVDSLEWAGEYLIVDAPGKYAFAMVFTTRQHKME
jgi:hypothetical protein